MEWKLNNCCISISDGDHLPPPKTDSGIPFITISNIVANQINFDDTLFVPIEYYEKLDNIRKAQINDILYSVVGSFGKPVLIKDDRKFVFQRHIAILRPNSEIVDASFLYYIMLSKSFYAQADRVALGVAQRTISLSSLRNMKVELPSLDVQRRIASILSAYDNLIDNNNRRIRLLEQMAENLYKEWFVRFRFPGHEKAEFENGLPKGWEIVKMEKVLYVRYGKDHSKIEDGDIPILGSGGIMRYGNKKLYSSESVLIPRKGSLNNIMYINEPFWTVDTMFYTEMKYKNIAKYMYYVLSGIDMESFNSGAALPSMTTNILNHFKVIVPAEELLELFDEKISKLFALKKELQRQSDLVTRQRDLLLPRLMSGKLEVKAVSL